MYEKKYSKNHAERERNLTYDDNDTYKNKKNVKVNNKDERLHSETSYRKLSKIRDRTEETKQRRQEMLEQHLSCGDEYLHNLKVKHLKTVIAKNITYNSMEKRLFLERLKNWLIFIPKYILSHPIASLFLLIFSLQPRNADKRFKNRIQFFLFIKIRLEAHINNKLYLRQHKTIAVPSKEKMLFIFSWGLSISYKKKVD